MGIMGDPGVRAEGPAHSRGGSVPDIALIELDPMLVKEGSRYATILSYRSAKKLFHPVTREAAHLWTTFYRGVVLYRSQSLVSGEKRRGRLC